MSVSQRGEELVQFRTGVAHQPPQQARLQRGMIGYSERFAGGIAEMPEAYVTASLADHLIAKTPKRANGFLPRDSGQLRTHPVTTTLPMSIPDGSGIASP
jgi:hypothetical protein